MRAQNEPTNSPHKVQNREKYSQTSKCPKWSPGKISRKTWSQTREGPKMLFKGVPRETCSQTTKLARKWSPGEIPRKKVFTDKQSGQNCPRGYPREQDFTHPNLAITQTSFFITNNLEINKVLHILHKHRNNDCHTSQALEIRNNDRLTSGELEGTEIMIATRSGT